MNILKVCVGLAVAVFGALALLYFVGSCDVVSERYATYADAVADGAVTRGWIPPNMPHDAYDIRETHDIDTSRGVGTLRFLLENRAEWEAYFDSLDAVDGEIPVRLGAKKMSGDAYYRDRDFWFSVDFEQGWVKFVIEPPSSLRERPVSTD